MPRRCAPRTALAKSDSPAKRAKHAARAAAADRETVAAHAKEAGLQLVRFLYCDNDAIIRGKASGIASLSERMETGIGLTVAMHAFTMLDQLAPFEGMGPVGEVRLVPDPATFVMAPYAPRTGVMLSEMLALDGSAYAADARAFLKRMTARAEQHGLTVMAAFEPEWSLALADGDVLVPLDDSGCFTTIGMNSAQDVISDIIDALDAQGMRTAQYYPELGWGQQELSIEHAPALQAADRQILYRETVRAVARRRGMYAVFAPKPWPDQAGNGCHLHFSAWNAGGTTNVFHDAGGAHGLSAVGAQFTAGVLDHLPALVALTCASVNSYRRLQPQTWASAYRAWGPDNREGALRLASTFWGREAETTNVELKPCDATANPYLAMGGVIAAGLDGITRSLALPAPLLVDPHTLSDEARHAAGAERLPESLEVAVTNLEHDPVLLEAMGHLLARSYIAVKRLDIEAFAGADDAFEFRQHIRKY